MPAVPSTPSMRGLSWLGVEVIASFLSPSTTSQTQPEPKRAPGAPAASNFALKSSMDPKDSSMALASLSDGFPPLPVGAISNQKKLWL
eukprot:Skav217757  [mRNA]  locus=scaffold974:122616:122879:- [translate_table: standard]